MDANALQTYPYYCVPEQPLVTPKIKLRQPNFELRPSMDLCNLYIKGIKPGLTSAELFTMFKPFGRIISAKVMEDRHSSCKAGFGFVSYSSSVEAAKAIIEMYVETPKKEGDEEQKDPIMTVRFHEPKVVRPEHNYSQQLELLSNSPWCAHFYTRQQQKQVPLQPTEHHPISPGSSSYPPFMDPSSHSYFPTGNVHINASYYYYPPYWTDHHGVIYANYVGPPPMPMPTQHYIQEPPKNNDTEKNTTEARLKQLIDKTDQHVPENDKPKLIEKLLKLNQKELSNCLNNSVYLSKKIQSLMHTKEKQK